MQRSQLLKILSMTALVFFSSCSLFFDSSPIVTSDRKFKTNFKKAGWSKVDYPQAEIAYNKDSSFLYANSVCPSPKEDLEKLALDIFLYQKNISSKEVKKDYLQTKGQIEVEKKIFSLILTNYKKKNCYYEIVLLHPGEANAEIQEDYQEFLASFK